MAVFDEIFLVTAVYLYMFRDSVGYCLVHPSRGKSIVGDLELTRNDPQSGLEIHQLQ